MTTIAFDGKILSAEGREVVDNLIVSDKVRKLHYVEGGQFYLAVAGVTNDIPVYEEFFRTGQKPSDEYKFDSEVIIIDSTGHAMYGTCLNDMTEMDIPFAIGSGGDIAIGAMLAGADAVEAVKIACKKDVYSGGFISYVDIEAWTKARNNNNDNNERTTGSTIPDSSPA